MASYVRRLYEEGGGFEHYHMEWQETPRTYRYGSPPVLPGPDDIEEAAAMLFDHRDAIQQRFGVSAWFALEKLVQNSVNARGRPRPLLPLTERFISAL